jgi:hypothetical protein
MATAEDAPVWVAYDDAYLAPSVSYRRSFTEMPLTRKKTVYIERERVVKDRMLTPDEKSGFARTIGIDSDAPAAGEGPADFLEQERMCAGLAPIF